MEETLGTVVSGGEWAAVLIKDVIWPMLDSESDLAGTRIFSVPLESIVQFWTA